MYPNAKLVGPKGLVSKRSELNFNIVQPENPLDAELSTEFKAVALTGHPNEVRALLRSAFHLSDR